MKHYLLTSNNKHNAVDEINFSCVDWAYNVNRNACWRAPKRVMKLSMATHFARMQQIDEFSSLQRNCLFKRYHKKNLHHVDKLPLLWQRYIENVIKVLRKNIPKCIEVNTLLCTTKLK